MSEVKVFRLSTGEDIIGQKLDSSKSEHITLKQTFVIVPMQSKPGGPIQLMLTPYLPYAKDDIIHINMNMIISEVDPKIDIRNSYNLHLGSGIVEIQKPRLIVD